MPGHGWPGLEVNQGQGKQPGSKGSVQSLSVEKPRSQKQGDLSGEICLSGSDIQRVKQSARPVRLDIHEIKPESGQGDKGSVQT